MQILKRQKVENAKWERKKKKGIEKHESWYRKRRSRIHGRTVADDWAGAVMQKLLAIQKCYRRTDWHGKVKSRVSATKNVGAGSGLPHTAKGERVTDDCAMSAGMELGMEYVMELGGGHGAGHGTCHGTGQWGWNWAWNWAVGMELGMELLMELGGGHRASS